MHKRHDVYVTETAKSIQWMRKHGSAHRAYKSYAKCKESSKQSDTRMRHTRNQRTGVKYAVERVAQHNSRARLKHDTCMRKHNSEKESQNA